MAKLIYPTCLFPCLVQSGLLGGSESCAGVSNESEIRRLSIGKKKNPPVS